ncbi:hypothetical protein CLOP_g10174 [Closterium sp. NIES-67]|nr:hypothetical protein CLOP_g10174 [Closterium sp. NIES-67]
MSEEIAAQNGATVGERIVVGYALRPKRVASFIQPELLAHAQACGVEFVAIDPSRPLVDQGPFNMVLHKLEGEEWAANLGAYERAHPEVVVIDEYESVHKLDDRREMLEAVAHVDASEHGAQVDVPKQIIVERGTPPEDVAQILQDAGFSLPAVAKPLEANGTTSSHTLGLVLDERALLQLQAPVLLQEFVNHGGILFKLYVLGDKIMAFRRQSLPDIPPRDQWAPAADADADADAAADVAPEVPPSPSQGKWDSLRRGVGIVEFNRISNVHLSEEELRDSRVTDPPPALMHDLGATLRQHLRLHAFNVDILRQGGHDDRYFVVDINYMPGYERIPDFPQFFVEFVQQTVRKRAAHLAHLTASSFGSVAPAAAGGAAVAAADAVAAVASAGSLRGVWSSGSVGGVGSEGLELGEEERAELIRKELEVQEEAVQMPMMPYPVLQGKKKWVYVRAAMKLRGLSKPAGGGSGQES